ncbi:MAG: M23 family metallopeptidase, partial [Smithellaceae bacterium]|nr:M23 family metallopeptidase [Smithellaceae bacterium]
IAATIRPHQLKLKEHQAQLIISAVDHSWRKNTALVNRPVVIDMTPPRISLLTPTNYLNPGGTGVISYKSSEPLAVHGVMVNEIFSSGYPAQPDKDILIAYFPIPQGAKQGAMKIMVVAEDQAGNRSQISLPHLIRDKKFSQDKVVLSDNFLQSKMPEFEARFSELKGKTPLEIFVYINDRMRQDNFRQIQEITSKTSLKQHWQGTFLRMQNASPMAGFGEQRTYLYGGRPVGESVHLGVDLASTTNAPIQAANNGIVSFTGYLGIYGNTVIIDHGFGLLSLYSHLNDISATDGQAVNKGDIIGASGVSGLAGGDHLHFSIIVGGQFVEPKEWWDPKWIADNVTKKLAGALP